MHTHTHTSIWTHLDSYKTHIFKHTVCANELASSHRTATAALGRYIYTHTHTCSFLGSMWARLWYIHIHFMLWQNRQILSQAILTLCPPCRTFPYSAHGWLTANRKIYQDSMAVPLTQNRQMEAEDRLGSRRMQKKKWPGGWGRGSKKDQDVNVSHHHCKSITGGNWSTLRHRHRLRNAAIRMT